MMNTKDSRFRFVTLVVVLTASFNAQAQTPATTSLVQTVEPSFRIEPIVHRFTGRRGEVIPFEFEITSLGKPMNLKVFPVNLRQEESGVILHDASSEPSDAAKLTSPDQFRLGPGESGKITGKVTIPAAKTNYLSFGILVQDRGQEPTFDKIDGDKASTQAGIRFVTQYVLRVDIDTGNADPREFGQLRIDEGTVYSHQGLPRVKAYLDNPTNFAFECRVRATIDAKGSGKPRPFFLGMPSRSELADDGRYLIRIMPKSRLRLEASVDSPLFAGSQTLDVGVTNGRREVVGAKFAISLTPDSFPALASQIAYLGDAIAVVPSQIEVGTARGASRMLGIQLFNHSHEDQSVVLVATSRAGKAIDSVKISPAKFKVRAGRSKNVRLKVQSRAGNTSDSLGTISIVAQSENGQQAEQSLPLLVRHTQRQPPNISVSELQLVTQQGQPTFQLLVRNEGSSFVPVSADLEVATAGRALALSSGYGEWLEPGEEKTLTFRSDVDLPSGEYLLSLAVRTYDDAPIKTKTLSITLRDQVNENHESRRLPSSQAGRSS